MASARQQVEHRKDGITYYNQSRPVAEPMVATLSSDRRWVIASFMRTTGNVWGNPELTCQHVHPETLAQDQRAILEVKLVVLEGTLVDGLQKVRTQREVLKAIG